MQSRCIMPKPAWSVLSAAALLIAIVAGCESAPNPNSPEAKAQIEARQKSIQKEEAAANERLQKTKGKNAPVMKSIKGGLNAGQPAPS